MSTGWPHIFATQYPTVALQYLDDMFNQLSAASTATTSVSGAGLTGFSQTATYPTASIGLHGQSIFSVKDDPYNAKGDGIADDTSAIQSALNASAGKAVFLPNGTYLLSSDLTYNAAISGSLMLLGSGPGSILKPNGTTNGALHILGTAGVTTSPICLRDFAIQSGTSSTSTIGLHLDGIAHWLVSGIWIDGKGKMATGLQCSAAQQGEISGGQIFNCSTGGFLESVSGVRSNGIDWHGMTFSNTTTNFKIASSGCDDVFFRANHLSSAVMQIDASGGGTGTFVFAHNHIEPTGTNNSMILTDARASLFGNSFYGQSGTTDINASGATVVKIIGNLINANVTFGASALDCVLAYNDLGGTITDSSTRLRNFNNHNYSGSGLTSANIYNEIVVNAQTSSPGSIAIFNANNAAGGAWGIKVGGAGVSQDIYAQLGDVTLNGSTSGGLLAIKSGVSGTQWTKFTAAGVQSEASLLIKDGITAPIATTGYLTIFVDSADGGLKVISGSGTTKTLATSV